MGQNYGFFPSECLSVSCQYLSSGKRGFKKMYFSSFYITYYTEESKEWGNVSQNKQTNNCRIGVLSIITMVGVIAMITELDQWSIHLDQDELNVCDYF